VCIQFFGDFFCEEGISVLIAKDMQDMLLHFNLRIGEVRYLVYATQTNTLLFAFTQATGHK